MFKELALERESCRAFDGRPVPHDLLCEVMETACLSPSACNSQPWRMIAVEGEKAAAMRELISNTGRNLFVSEVSTFVAICETKAVLKPGTQQDHQHFAQMDLGMATVMLTLAAADKGLSTCILGCFDEQGIKEFLQIPADVPLRLVVAVGYAKQEGVRKKIRKPAEEIMGFQAW